MRLVRVAINLEQLLYRSPGGIGRYTARLAMVLPRLFPGDEVLGFTARHPSVEVRRALDDAGLTAQHPSVLALPRPLLYEAWHRVGLPPLTFGAPRLGRADLVHAPSVAVPPRGRVPLVVTVHDAAPELFPEAFPPRGLRFHRAGLAATARRADLVVTVSEAAAEEIVAHSPLTRDRIRVVPNGVEVPVVTEAERSAVVEAAGLAGRPYVLWVGSLEPRKGVGTVVSAMAELHRRGVEARLVLAGYAGWLGDGLIDVGDRRELGADLVERGRVDDDELWALYAGAAVFAFPSRHEGFGLPVLEAMAQGTPVVCSDIPALREVAGGLARLVAPGDVSGWAEALGEVLAEPDQAVGEAAARRSHAAAWSVDRSVRGTRAVYQEVLGVT
jgi:glycosyltransferase involved in cell wall biosynthesis